MISSTEHLSASRSTVPPLSLYHLLDPEVLANPYPLYQRLRTEDPVHWDPYLHAWVVTRYEDVLTVLLRFSAARTPRRSNWKRWASRRSARSRPSWSSRCFSWMRPRTRVCGLWPLTPSRPTGLPFFVPISRKSATG